MRREPNIRIEQYRKIHPALGDSPPGKSYGYFEVTGASDQILRVISSGVGDEWEHVSVSCINRCPAWSEMALVKELFWDETETVVQFHPKKSEHVNYHQYCLHLWKLSGHDCKLPPKELLA